MNEVEISDFVKHVHVGDYVTLDCEFRRLIRKPQKLKLTGYIEILTSSSIHLSHENPLENPKERVFFPSGIYYEAIKSYSLK